MSREISERKWKETLMSVLEELDKQEYEKMLSHLERIPRGLKAGKSLVEMVHVIVQHYGLKDSISEVSEIMKKIPRNDEKIQNLLSPFMDKLKERTKRKFKKNKVVSNSDSTDKENEAVVDEPKRKKPDEDKEIPSWRKSIRHLKIDRDLGQKAIVGKVVQKSGVQTYQTKTKDEKFCFYMGVADDTGFIKVMVYGKELFKQFKEKTYYTFRNILMEEELMKVTKKSYFSKTSALNIPEDLELEAQMLIYFQKPVCSIAKAKIYEDKTIVSVEGTLKQIGPVEHIKIKNKRRKRERQEFTLDDDSDSITVRLWGKETSELRGKSDGDFIRVINVKTNHYNNTVSLNSTDHTRILKVKSAAVQNVIAQIIGIVNAGRSETELDAEISSEIVRLSVKSSLLAKAFGIRLNSDFEERLLEIIPLTANAKIQGNTIIKIEEM